MTPTPGGDPAATLLLRQNRLYSMLSRTNRVIVRAQSPGEMYDAVCHVAIEQGGFGVARIVLRAPVEPSLVVVSQAGVRIADPALLTGGAILQEEQAAVESGQAVVVNMPTTSPLKGGSLASIPIRQDGDIVGAFTVITEETGFCTYAEVKLLLMEVAEDVSFALDAMLREERRLAAESKMRFLAHYDMQTSLPQRPLFEERLAAASHGGSVAVLAVRLCNYHGLLQVLGQASSTAIVRAVTARIAELLPAATLGRISECEFALILEHADDNHAVAETAAAISRVVAVAIPIESEEIFVDPFVGIALSPNDGKPPEVLKAALLAAKLDAPDRASSYRFFVADMDRDSRQRLDLEAGLRHALERSEFLLHYQPQIDLQSGQLVGAEALLRWNRPGGGPVSPAEFIPVLESTGMINSVGEWVLNEACLAAQRWQNQGLPPCRIAVNLSARQFQDSDIRAMVRRALDLSKLSPNLLELELTEGIVLVNTENVIRTLHDLKMDGVAHALDDFGTGYSSLSYLQRLPVSRLKIDRSFISNITHNPSDAAITRAIVGMAHSLGLSVIAEGVETEGQLGYLRILRCEEMQGYFFSPPLPEGKFVELLRSGAGINPASVGAGERVLLLVDDEPQILPVLQRLLHGTRTRILTANTVERAFTLLSTEPVGVVVCDQRMPEMTGTEFLRRVKLIHPGVMRIVLSGYADLNSVIDAVNHGAVYKFLTKPWLDDVLRDALEDAFIRHEMERENLMLTQRVDDMLNNREQITMPF